MVRDSRISILLSIISVSTFVVGCGGNNSTPIPDTNNPPVAGFPVAGLDSAPMETVFQVRMKPQEPQEFSAKGISWTNPLQLSNLLPEPGKLTSAGEELMKDASSYELGLPSQHVSAAITPYATYSPNWTSASQGTDDLAYAMYRFSLDGYEVLPEETLGYAWETPPADYTNLWIGLGNTDTDAWDWYEGDSDGAITIAGTGKYIDGTTNNLLLAVVLLGTDESVLTQLRLGVYELRGTGGMDSIPEDDGTPPLFGGVLGSSIDLTPGCSPVNDQGVTGSCTAFAIGDAAYNYELGSIYGEYGWNFDDDFNLTSPRYLYVETGADQGLDCPYQGRHTDQVVEWLQLNGVATELNAPWGSPPEDGWCDRDWSTEAQTDAGLLDIEVWSSVNPRGETGVLNVKTILFQQQRPVIVQTGLDWEFTQYAPGEVWNYTGPVIGYHAMCIVGYDDSMDGGNGAFKVRNSWSDAWGDGGYCWIGYQTFIDVSPALWCFTIQDEYEAVVAARFCSSAPDLEPPTGLQASDGEFTDYIMLTWNPVETAEGYYIYRDSQDIPMVYVTVEDLITPDEPWFADNDVTDFLAHTYWVSAYNGTIESPLSAPDTGYLAQAPEIVNVTPTSGDPGADVTFFPTVYGTSPMTFNWNFGGGATPNTSTNVSPQVTLGADGTFDASLNVSNSFGSDEYLFTLSVGGGEPGGSGDWWCFGHDRQNTHRSPFVGAQTNNVKWSYTTGSAVQSSPAIGADGTVYVGSNDDKLYALNQDGSLKWSYTTGGNIGSSPAIGADGTVYVGHVDDKLYAINSDGTLKWSYTTGSFVYWWILK